MTIEETVAEMRYHATRGGSYMIVAPDEVQQARLPSATGSVWKCLGVLALMHPGRTLHSLLADGWRIEKL